MFDKNQAVSKDIVTREQAEIRASQISDIKTTYKLGLRMGDIFTGEAKIAFTYSGNGDIWLNMSVLAVANIKINGANLSGFEGVTYDRHKLTISAELLSKEATNELCFRYMNTYSKPSYSGL